MPARTDLEPEYITPMGLRGGAWPDKVRARMSVLPRVLAGNAMFFDFQPVNIPAK